MKRGLNMVIFEDDDSRLSSYQHADVLYDNNSLTIFDRENYVGSHMIRDPRDIIVSGYFYHLWTQEAWVHVVRPEWGMTYQEKINSMSKDEGMMFEMKNMGAVTIERMRVWNYNNPKMLEIRYEDLILNPDEIFARLFHHWGVVPEWMDQCMEVSRRHHMTAKTGRKLGEVDPKSHMRSGEPGQWRLHFTEEHKEYFKEKFGETLIALGYEKNNDW